MTVQQILDRTEGDLVQEEDQFTALCYAVITRFICNVPAFPTEIPQTANQLT